MHRFQAIAAVGWMYADPYTREVTRKQRRAASMTWLSLFVSLVAFVAYTLPVLIAVYWPADAITARTQTALLLTAVEYENWIFGISGLLLLLAAMAMWSAGRPHTLDPEITRQCRRVRHLNRWALRTSAVIWLAGILNAYIATSVRLALGG